MVECGCGGNGEWEMGQRAGHDMAKWEVSIIFAISDLSPTSNLFLGSLGIAGG
jgi:hypothetical protein